MAGVVAAGREGGDVAEALEVGRSDDGRYWVPAGLWTEARQLRRELEDARRELARLRAALRGEEDKVEALIRARHGLNNNSNNEEVRHV